MGIGGRFYNGWRVVGATLNPWHSQVMAGQDHEAVAL